MGPIDASSIRPDTEGPNLVHIPPLGRTRSTRSFNHMASARVQDSDKVDGMNSTEMSANPRDSHRTRIDEADSAWEGKNDSDSNREKLAMQCVLLGTSIGVIPS